MDKDPVSSDNLLGLCGRGTRGVAGGVAELSGISEECLDPCVSTERDGDTRGGSGSVVPDTVAGRPPMPMACVATVPLPLRPEDVSGVGGLVERFAFVFRTALIVPASPLLTALPVLTSAVERLALFSTGPAPESPPRDKLSILPSPIADIGPDIIPGDFFLSGVTEAAASLLPAGAISDGTTR